MTLPILTLLVGLGVGTIIGAILTDVLSVQPAQRHIAYYRGRSIRHQALAEQARKPHLGTPYLRRDDVLTPVRLDLADNEGWSVRAELLADPVTGDVVPMRVHTAPPQQVQTGRPA